ncbi:MAG: cation:proton antiporter [Anaerolineae bacterium]|nr:cation:proton antiporter [Anaerolineae bacterium]
MNLSLLALLISLPLLVGAMLLAFFRLLRGPSLPDRVVALDFLSLIGISVTAVYAIATNVSLMLDVALVIALLSFLGTVAFAYYIERSTLRDQ